MLKMPIDEFVYEVKEELLCYEELGEAKVNEWEEKFMAWVNNDNVKKKNVKANGDEKFYLLEDESEIFDFADEFVSAVELKKEEEYWNKLK